MNYYGKPFQTVVTLKTLWQESKAHIDTIYIIIEKEQPQNRYDSIPLLKFLLRGLPVVYFTPQYFYYGVGSPPTDWMEDPAKRYGLNFQYAFEKTDKEFIFVTHNDCLYKEDLLGQMLVSLESEPSTNKIGGIGLIGQCWNCPAFSAKLCNSEGFEKYVPNAQELSAMLETYPVPRKAIHEDLIKIGHIHPLPECRLNEYACLINTIAYNREVVPQGKVLPLGGSWHGTDTGAAWFYDMYHLGYKFINFPFEPAMEHAPFSVTGSGHTNNSDRELYEQSENKAYEFLVAHQLMLPEIPLHVRLGQYQLRLNYLIRKIGRSLKRRLVG